MPRDKRKCPHVSRTGASQPLRSSGVCHKFAKHLALQDDETRARKKRKRGVAEKQPVEVICATGRGRKSEEKDVACSISKLLTSIARFSPSKHASRLN